METRMNRADSDYVSAYLAETVAVTQAFAADPAAQATLVAMAEAITRAMQGGGKLLVAGNGGSAGDAQHIAGEFISRLMYDRAPLPAIALTTDSSVITATGNDYGYEYIFERQVLGLGKAGDVLLGISTSGSSRNVVLALSAARARGLVLQNLAGRFLRAQPSSRLPLRREALRQLEKRLHALGPEQVLARGYSLTTDAATGAVLRDATKVAAGQKLKTRLAQGEVISVAAKD